MTHALPPATAMCRCEALFLRLIGQLPRPASIMDPHLNVGSSLHAVLLSEAYHLTADETHLAAAIAHLERAGQLFGAIPLNSSLYRGICGFAWALQSFPKPQLISRFEETLAEIDTLLVDALEVSRNYHIDVVSGIAGIGVHALARGKQSSTTAALWEVLDGLLANFLGTWLEDPLDALPADGMARNLGVAHGVPGLLSMAAIAATRGFLGPQSVQLVCDSLDRLWELAILTDGSGQLRSRAADPAPARLAWCYGGFGLASTFRNGIGLDEANRGRTGEIARRCVHQYRNQQHRMADASLCHGYAGAAIAFRHIARTPGLDPVLAEELGELCQATTNAMLEREVLRDGRSTFMHWSRNRPVASDSFLEGGAGVALVSAALAGDRTPAWMNLLTYY